MLHGWIVLDKPVGLGSTQAVSAVKRALREAGEPKTKVGHGGTLDPLASGVLPIAIGEATKVAGRMLDATKGYDFTISFGVETDTLDGEGEIVATSGVRPALEQIEAILPSFTGEIEQVPPAYSALKIGGKAAYARARAGEDVKLKSRRVTIHALSIRHPRASGGPASSGQQRDSRLCGNERSLPPHREYFSMSTDLPKPDHAHNMRLLGYSDQGGRPDGVQVMVHRGFVPEFLHAAEHVQSRRVRRN